VTGKLNDFCLWNFDARALLGWDYKLNKTNDFTPYFGAGYRRLLDESGGWVDYFNYNYDKYPTVISYFYMPFGVETHTKINEQWDVNFKSEVDVVFYGTAAFHLNDIPGTFNFTDVNTGAVYVGRPLEADSTLNGGYGFRESLKFIRKYKYCDFYVEPFFSYLFLNQSNAKQGQIDNLTTGGTWVSVYPNGTPYKPLWLAKNSTVDVGARAGIEF